MGIRKEKEIRTKTANLLICKCLEEDGKKVLEFGQHKRKDNMTIEEFLEEVYKD